MTAEEEQALREENTRLQEQVRSQQELLEQQAQQIAVLSAQVAELQAHLSKDSHKSHLPPSSDRFKRQPKSLRKKSGKKAGGQPGHRGQMLSLVEHPDTVLLHPVESCPACAADLRSTSALQVERRQVIELPRKLLVVIEQQAERKCCPQCQEVILAPFPEEVMLLCNMAPPWQWWPSTWCNSSCCPMSG